MSEIFYVDSALSGMNRVKVREIIFTFYYKAPRKTYGSAIHLTNQFTDGGQTTN